MGGSGFVRIVACGSLGTVTRAGLGDTHGWNGCLFVILTARPLKCMSDT